MKGTNDSCGEVLEAKTEKKLLTRHNLGCLPSPGLVLPHPYARIPVFHLFRAFLVGIWGGKNVGTPIPLLICLTKRSFLGTKQATEQYKTQRAEVCWVPKTRLRNQSLNYLTMMPF